jgi:3-oxoacyl-[acyl-carrier-protein] synthase III
MSKIKTSNVKIAGISSCVPRNIIRISEYNWIKKKLREKMIETTGIIEKRHVNKGTTTSDLCVIAAEKLLEELKWDRNEIDILVFVSVTPDYVSPSTSNILQHKLGLSKNTLCIDINQACSGYVYGLSVISKFISVENRKGLLLVGDVNSYRISYRDKTTYPIFGDAGTATAIEYCEQTNANLFFNLKSDGSGYSDIIIKDGGVRNFFNKDSLKFKKYEEGIIRQDIHTSMDGLNVFKFALREVPSSILETLDFASSSINDVDYFILHQANALINKSICKILNIDHSKAPNSLDKYGNTVSASIPLTIVSELNFQAATENLKFLVAGFGAGLSWGCALFDISKIICPPVIEL